ncbi:MAG: D-aminoacyl-tRNA deacylase [Candidatus Bathyarchaeia archaeon]
MILFIASEVDVASMNIAHQLITNNDFEKTSEYFDGNPIYSKKLEDGEIGKLIFIKEEPVNTQFLVLPFTSRLLIYLSRHSSKSGTSTLSVHTPGNIGEASLGGLARKVSISPASAMKEALNMMKKTQEESGLDYEVSYECTHHGPSLNIPTMFIELGSSPMQWQDSAAASAVAEGAMAAATCKKTYFTVLGIGGPHYNKKFTEVALNTEKAFGHIIPKYAISKMGLGMLRQCIDRTVEDVKEIILDWKGIVGSDKKALLHLLDKIDLEAKKI